MTDCATTRDWILEMDPEELERHGSGDRQNGTVDRQDGAEAHRGDTDAHAAHLTACAECRALADEILGAEAILRDGLGSVTPALDVETALLRAREAHQAGAVHRAVRRRRRWQVALPLAAAALGGLLLIGRPSPARIADLDPATVTAARALGLVGSGPVVRAGRNDRVAVLPTENPNITVIWFME